MSAIAIILLALVVLFAPAFFDEPREWVIAALLVALVIGLDLADAVRHVNFPRPRRVFPARAARGLSDLDMERERQAR